MWTLRANPVDRILKKRIAIMRYRMNLIYLTNQNWSKKQGSLDYDRFCSVVIQNTTVHFYEK